MEKIVAGGPLNDEMRAVLKSELPPSGFEIKFISSREEYSELEYADYIILRTLPLDREDIKKIKKAKLIQRWGVGIDGTDIEAAALQGIPVAIAAGVNSTAVAEMTLSLTLAVMRNIVCLHNGIMAGRHERELYGAQSYTVNGKTAGVVGMGNIGKKVAYLFQAFGVKDVVYHDPFRLTEVQEKELNLTYQSLDDLLRQSDIVTLHTPLTNDTKNLINAETLAKMKNGAVLINTAREKLIDLEALAEALKNGKLSGAGIDAIEADTVKNNNPLKGLPNVVLTAHVGGNTVDNYSQSARHCIENILRVSRCEALPVADLVNVNYLLKSKT